MNIPVFSLTGGLPESVFWISVAAVLLDQGIDNFYQAGKFDPLEGNNKEKKILSKKGWQLLAATISLLIGGTYAATIFFAYLLYLFGKEIIPFIWSTICDIWDGMTVFWRK